MDMKAQCVGCPPLTSDTIPNVPCNFNGQTSSVTQYNGVTPTCYTPTNVSLNGHLQGINNAFCAIRNKVDSLLNNQQDCDSILLAFETQLDSVASLINYYDVISSDSSVTVTRDTTDGVIAFDLSVPVYVPNVDATCLGITEPTLDNVLQALIDAACLNEEED
jgi:hypothetical protein